MSVFDGFLSGGGSSSGGSGDVTGPASSTDNAVARWDLATGKLLQDSGLIVSDVAAGAITVTSTAGTAITLKNTDPAATTGASVAGDSLAITAGNAVASTDTNGAAAGGDVILTAGAAARRASGDAQGGNIQLKVGAGIGTYPKGFINADGSNGGLRLAGDTASGQPLSWFTSSAWRGALSNYGAYLSSASVLNWTAGSTETDSADTGLARSAAGWVKITDGSSGAGNLHLSGGIRVETADLAVYNSNSSAWAKFRTGTPVTASTAGVGSPKVLDWYECGRHVWTNEGASAKAYFTLPTAAAGLHVKFVCQDADGLRITANTDDTIRVIDKVTAAAGYLETTTIGSVITLEAINATEWFAMAIHGTWTDGTFTYDDTSLTTP